jgi:hypothetical protein
MKRHYLMMTAPLTCLPLLACLVDSDGSGSGSEASVATASQAINGPTAHDAEQWKLDRAAFVQTPIPGSNPQSFQLCTATRIAPRYVMTAAHCATDTTTRVNFFTTGPRFDSSPQANVLSVKMRPGVTKDTLSDSSGKLADFALLEIDRTIPTGDIATLAWAYPGSGPWGTKVGAGRANDNAANLGRLMTIDDWLRTDDDTSGPFRTGRNFVDKGDSGGPFYLDGRVLGVLSTEDIYARYTSVRIHLPWILSAIGYRWGGQRPVADKAQQGHVKEAMLAPESVCQYACEQQTACLAYNYAPVTGTCSILDSLSGAVSAAPGFRYGLHYGKGSSRTGDPVAYARSDGNSAVVHRSTDAHVHELSLGTGSWAAGDLSQAQPFTGNVGSAPPAFGRSTAYVRSDRSNAVVYRTTSGSLIEVALTSNWFWRNLTSAASAPATAGEPAAYVRTDGVSAVVYRDGVGNIRELTPVGDSPSGGWKQTNLSAVPAQITSQAPVAASNLSAYLRSDHFNSIVYRGPDNHIYELFSRNGVNWDFGFPWANAWAANGSSAPVAAAGNPFGYVRHDGTNAILYRGTDNHVYELWMSSTGWQVGDVTGLAHAASWQLAAGDPSGYVRADGTTAVVYRSVSGDIMEVPLNSTTGWQTVGDLSSWGGNAWLGLAAGDPVPYVRADGTNSVVFRDASNRVRELTMTGPGWQAWDLTFASGETP